MRRKLMVSMLAALLVSMMSVGLAGAAPAKNPHAETRTLDCEGVEYEVIVANGNAAHVVDSTQRGIPHHFTYSIEADGEIIYSAEDGVGNGNKKGLQDRLVTCTGSFVLGEEDVALISEYLGIDLTGMVVVEHLSVEVMITPAGKR